MLIQIGFRIAAYHNFMCYNNQSNLKLPSSFFAFVGRVIRLTEFKVIYGPSPTVHILEAVLMVSPNLVQTHKLQCNTIDLLSGNTWYCNNK